MTTQSGIMGEPRIRLTVMVMGVLAMHVTRTMMVYVVGVTVSFAVVGGGIIMSVCMAVSVLRLAVCARLARGHHRTSHAAAFGLVERTVCAAVTLAVAVSVSVTGAGAVRRMPMTVVRAAVFGRGRGGHKGSVSGRQHAAVRVHLHLLCLLLFVVLATEKLCHPLDSRVKAHFCGTHKGAGEMSAATVPTVVPAVVTTVLSTGLVREG
mmetsp:Transcript_23208/g.40148  ORF Transcript_23208/g.40148 Transcript_23208/m.40148 type:complete len:208 (+) Transcript_23208:413-1036(+)